MNNFTQRPDGEWVTAEPLPDPFGVLWGRLWHQRRRRGQATWSALFASFRDARAINKLAVLRPPTPEGGADGS